MKKKDFLIGILILFVLLVSTCATTNGSQNNTVAHRPSHFTYERVTDWGIKITDLRGEFTSIIIPYSISGRVREIGDGAFRRKNITEVTFPEIIFTDAFSSFTIGKNAFANNELTEVSISGSLSASARYGGSISIRDGAFRGNKLTKVSLKRTYGIGDYAFADNEIAELSIQDGSSIGYGAFENNKLTEIVIPNTIGTIYSRAFAKNNLVSVELPDSVTTLGIDVFSDNNLSQPFVLPDTVKTIRFPRYIPIQLWNSTEIEISSFEGTITGAGNSRIIEITRGAEMWKRSHTYTGIDITIPSHAYSIPVTRIKAGFGSGRIEQGISGWADRDLYRQKIKTLTLPETLTAIELGAFAFCDIENVVTPNANIKRLWDEHFVKQQEADRIAYQRAYNLTVEQMQRAFR